MPNRFTGTTNEQYHANKTHLSSSSFKTILKSPQKFYNEHILGQRESYSSDALIDGTYVHSCLLEPETLSKYVVFNGLRRAGTAWESFKEANNDKIILTAQQYTRCQALLAGYAKNPLAIELLKGGNSEFSLAGEVFGIPVKCRADYVNISTGTIVDVKTSSKYTDIDEFRSTIEEYRYDLSASLYLEIFEAHYGKPFQFIFLVLSKADNVCTLYKLSQDTRDIGKKLLSEAASIYKRCIKTGIWQLEPDLITINNEQHELMEV